MPTPIVFIDSAVSNYQSIIDVLAPNTDYVLLTADADGLSQVAQALEGRSDIDAIHIISHGAEGSLSLGTLTLNSANVSEYSAVLATIGQHLSTTGDVLLYGCNVAAGQVGEQFIASLAQYMGADVAASDDLTGATGLGGDWQLEVSAGEVSTTTLTANNWQGVLGVNTTLANYDLNLMADLAGLAKAAYSSGVALTNEVNTLGWTLFNSTSVSNAQVFCADRVVDSKKEMVIAFRGTELSAAEGYGDWLTTNLPAWGFCDYYKNVRSSVEDWLVKAYLGNYDKVYLTGHSLGGAAAQIALLDILEDSNSSVWTNISSGSSTDTPLQTGDRFMDGRRSDLRLAVKAYVQDHVQGATFGAPSISIDSPNTWFIPFKESYQINPAFNLEAYKEKLFQFEHKIGSGNSVLQQFLNEMASTTEADVLRRAKDFLFLGLGALAGDVTVSIAQNVFKRMFDSMLNGLPVDNRNDDPVALLNSAQFDGTTLTWLSELGTLQTIDLDDSIYNRYANLNGGSGVIMLHSMDYYVESLLRATTNNALITATSSRVEFANNYPTLSSTVASTGNDLIQVGTTSSSGNGNDILVASTNTNNLTGGLGNDAFVIKGSGADITLVGSKERKDHLYFNMEGTITAQENGEALEITISGPSGSRKVTIANWYAGGGNAYQLYEIAKITPVTVISQAALTQNNNYYNQTDLANRNFMALGIAFLNEGGSLSDRILGSFSNDTMRGYAGDDNMSGRDGNDIIYGDAGSDVIEGGAGNDTIVDNEGFNTIYGGTGDDAITASHSVVDGGDGTDVLTANMSGSSNYGSGYNSGYRENGLQYSRAAGGATIGFDSGFESVEAFLSDVAGRINVYNGGLDALNQQYQLASWQSIEKILVTGTSQTGEYEGNDLLMVIGSGGTYIGGSAANYDTLYADWNTATVVIDWDSSRTSVQTLNGVQVQGIERVLFRLGSGNDIIKNTNATSDQIYAGAGNDTISLGAGVKFVDGGDGNDTITGSRGNYNGGDGADVLTANMSGSSNYGSGYNSGYRENGLQYSRAAGGATIGFDSGFESVEAFLSDVAGRINVYNGGLDALNQQYQLASWQSIEKISVTGTSQTGEYEGNDLLMVIGSGGTYIGGSAANYDTLYADWNTATAVIDWDSSRTSVQTLNGVQVQGIERVLFRLGSGNDIIKNTNATSDQIYAGAGNDTISLVAGVNFVDGGDGNDTITGSRGNYNGGDGADVLTANMSGSSNYGSSYNYQYRENGLQYSSAAGGATIGFNSGFESVEAFLSGVAGRIDVYNSGLDALNQQYQLASWQSIEKISVTGTSQTGEYEGNDLLMVIGSGGTYIGGSAANYDTLYADWNTATVAINWNNNTGSTTSQIINGVTIQGIERLLLKTGSADDIIRNSSYAAGDQILSGAGNDQLYTGAGTDLLKGEAGNDTLDGGAGADRLEGGIGNDVYYVDNAGDVVVELDNNGTDKVNASISYTLTVNIEDLVLTGTAAINGTGNTTNNVLTGNTADNILDGGVGSDSLTGGAGNDTYIVDVAGDVVTENANEGTDTVQSAVSYTLGANLENLTLTGVATINGTGNAANNIIIGNSANNVLDGGAGNDALTGGAGNDTYIVDAIGDVITENVNEGTDSVQSSVTYTLSANLENLTLTSVAAINGTGNAINNLITGNSANNAIDGAAGNDTLIGGAGNDTYVVDSANDVVTENLNEGTDSVQSSVTYTLGANLENLTLTGATAINGTGNTLNNTLVGNSGNNTLDGGVGNDTLTGGLGNDTYLVDAAGDVVTENANEGTDSVQSSVTYTLGANLENLTLTGATAINGTGNTLNNTLVGNSGNNLLDGGVGNDTFTGGLGNDTYVIDAAGDVVTENANEGTDSVQSSVTYTLGANLENLTLTGATAINGTGNAANNIIIGNSANNVLEGGAGNDTLQGGIGSDTYTMISGFGQDVIDDTQNGGTDLNTISMMTYSNSALNYTRVGNDYVIAAKTGTDQVTIKNFFDAANTTDYRLVLSSGTLTRAQLSALTITGVTKTGTTANDTLTGGDSDDTLNGLAGNDSLDGATGADTLVGGIGDDIYIVDNINDVVTEALNEGTDTVQSSISYILNTNLENLTLTGSVVINGTGNAANNLMMGNAANNSLTGGAGDDTLNGGAGNDALAGGIGNDTYVIDVAGDSITEAAGEGTDTVQSDVSYTLGTNVENLTLTGSATINGTGNAANNIIIGNSANNVLEGGAGNDALTGGAGNDTYGIDAVGDVITENANEGIDLVQSSVTYTLSANLENLTLTGAVAINGTGNSLNNTLVGNSGNNILTGGVGNDTLTGGAGSDTYRYNKGDGLDLIINTDNSVGRSDILQVSGLGFQDFTFSRTVNTLVVSAGATDSISVQDFYANAANQLDRIEYSNGAGVVNHVTGSIDFTSTDTANLQSWSSWHQVRNAQLQIVQDDIVMDNGSKSNLEYDVSNTKAWQSYRTGLDSAARTDWVQVLNDDGSFDQTDWDQANNQLWVVRNDHKDNANRLDWIRIQNDNGSFDQTDFDQANAQTWKEQNRHLDSQNRLDYIQTINDDTTVDWQDEDQDNSQTWTTGNSHQLADGRLDWRRYINDNGTEDWLDLDQDNTQTWTEQSSRKDSLGRDDSRTVIWDNNTKDITDLDQTNVEMWQQSTQHFNTAGAYLGSDMLLDAGIAANTVWLRQSGNNLEVSQIGTTKKMVLADWFLNKPTLQKTNFQLASGGTLLATEVQALVTAMASFAPPAVGQTSLTTAQHQALDSVIAANWS